MKSVPEFFGEITASWIRLPLYEPGSGAALPPTERRARYDMLARVAERLEAEEISWKDAVQIYCEDPVTRKRDGYLGIIEREMVPQYEEPFLRELFQGHGFQRVERDQIRGPIMGDRWVYLVHINWIESRGVVELNRRINRVDRSYREFLLREKLSELNDGIERAVRIP